MSAKGRQPQEDTQSQHGVKKKKNPRFSSRSQSSQSLNVSINRKQEIQIRDSEIFECPEYLADLKYHLYTDIQQLKMDVDEMTEKLQQLKAEENEDIENEISYRKYTEVYKLSNVKALEKRNSLSIQYEELIVEHEKIDNQLQMVKDMFSDENEKTLKTDILQLNNDIVDVQHENELLERQIAKLVHSLYKPSLVEAKETGDYYDEEIKGLQKQLSHQMRKESKINKKIAKLEEEGPKINVEGQIEVENLKKRLSHFKHERQVRETDLKTLQAKTLVEKNAFIDLKKRIQKEKKENEERVNFNKKKIAQRPRYRPRGPAVAASDGIDYLHTRAPKRSQQNSVNSSQTSKSAANSKKSDVSSVSSTFEPSKTKNSGSEAKIKPIVVKIDNDVQIYNEPSQHSSRDSSKLENEPKSSNIDDQDFQSFSSSSDKKKQEDKEQIVALKEDSDHEIDKEIQSAKVSNNDNKEKNNIPNIPTEHDNNVDENEENTKLNEPTLYNQDQKESIQEEDKEIEEHENSAEIQPMEDQQNEEDNTEQPNIIENKEVLNDQPNATVNDEEVQAKTIDNAENDMAPDKDENNNVLEEKSNENEDKSPNLADKSKSQSSDQDLEILLSDDDIKPKDEIHYKAEEKAEERQNVSDKLKSQSSDQEVNVILPVDGDIAPNDEQPDKSNDKEEETKETSDKSKSHSSDVLNALLSDDDNNEPENPEVEHNSDKVDQQEPEHKQEIEEKTDANETNTNIQENHSVSSKKTDSTDFEFESDPSPANFEDDLSERDDKIILDLNNPMEIEEPPQMIVVPMPAEIDPLPEPNVDADDDDSDIISRPVSSQTRVSLAGSLFNNQLDAFIQSIPGNQAPKDVT